MEFAARETKQNKTKLYNAVILILVYAFSEILYFSIDDLTFDDDHTS